MEVWRLFNAQKVTEYIASWMRELTLSAGAKGGIFGVSGGLDSAVVVGLAKRAWGEDCLGLVLPCYSQDEDVKDAIDVLNHFDCRYKVIDLGPQFDSLKEMLPPAPSGHVLPEANLKPRLRMTTLYYFANLMNYMVVGTTNKSEWFVGYFTKYGDGGVDMLPLADLAKSEVREVARYLGVPDRIINKVPSGGLWKGQTDEAEMGLSYEDLDAYVLGKKISSEVELKILDMHTKTEHKRNIPPIPGISKDLKEE
jgi:NAD+ synthase